MKSLHGNTEKPFSEVVNIKSELCWRTPDVGDTSALGYLPRTATGRAWDQPTGEDGVIVMKSGRDRRSDKPFHCRHGDAGFEVFPAGFHSCLGPAFLPRFPFLPFGVVMPILCHGKNGIHILVLQIFTVKR